MNFQDIITTSETSLLIGDVRLSCVSAESIEWIDQRRADVTLQCPYHVKQFADMIVSGITVDLMSTCSGIRPTRDNSRLIFSMRDIYGVRKRMLDSVTYSKEESMLTIEINFFCTLEFADAST